jgi:hypothetical protein
MAVVPALRNGDEVPKPVPVAMLLSPYDAAVAVVALVRSNSQKL